MSRHCFYLFLIFAVVTSAAAQEQHNGQPVVAGEVLIKLSHPTAQSIAAVQQLADSDSMALVGGTGVMRLHSRSQSVAALLAALSHRPEVAYVEPNYILHADNTVPNDPQFGQLWAMVNTGQSVGQTGTAGADIGATLAWDLSTGTRANVVGVVDSGVDYTHSDLAANMWSAPTSFTVTVGGHTITCPAGSHGFNAILLTCDPMDDNSHGTHVSGTIGATGNNAAGVVGVNWVASIMGLKFLDSAGNGSTANAINAIEFAIQAKAAFAASAGANVRVLNNSWGGSTFSQALLDEINRANNNNMLFVVSAGNYTTNIDSSPYYPAAYTAPNLVTVAATDNRDQLASFSNYGATKVHLGAPGVYVLSTVRGNTYQYYNGTSMAAPHVSGAAALLLAQCALSTASLRATLLGNVDLISSLSGKTTTGGRLDVNKAIHACAANVSAPDFSLVASPSSQSTTAGNAVAYTVNVGALNGFTGTVGLSVSGLPAGTTASFTPASIAVAGSSTLKLQTSASTPAGNHLLTIAGTSGGAQHSANVTLTVNAPAAAATFSLSATPASQTVVRQGTAVFSVTVASLNGFTGPISLSISPLGGGMKASFSPAVVNTQGTSTLTVTAGNQRGTFNLTITGTSGGLSKSTVVQVNVNR